MKWQSTAIQHSTGQPAPCSASHTTVMPRVTTHVIVRPEPRFVTRVMLEVYVKTTSTNVPRILAWAETVLMVLMDSSVSAAKGLRVRFIGANVDLVLKWNFWDARWQQTYPVNPFFSVMRICSSELLLEIYQVSLLPPVIQSLWLITQERKIYKCIVGYNWVVVVFSVVEGGRLIWEALLTVTSLRLCIPAWTFSLWIFCEWNFHRLVIHLPLYRIKRFTFPNHHWLKALDK